MVSCEGMRWCLATERGGVLRPKEVVSCDRKRWCLATERGGVLRPKEVVSSDPVSEDPINHVVLNNLHSKTSYLKGSLALSVFEMTMWIFSLSVLIYRGP